MDFLITTIVLVFIISIASGIIVISFLILDKIFINRIILTNEDKALLRNAIDLIEQSFGENKELERIYNKLK